MSTVGLRELKNRLSQYIRLVRAGESVFVTDRGEVIAEIRPSGASGQAEPARISLAKLRRAGLATIGRPNERRLYPALPRIVRKGRTQELLDEERGAR